MLFNSYFFIFVFLPVVFIFYYFLNRKKLTLASKVWLAGASLVFYASWNINFLPLILISIAFNFGIGASLGSMQRVSKNLRKSLLVCGIILNIALLGYYKYYLWAAVNVNVFFKTPFLALPPIILPLGISFFTFTQIAYLVDSYKGKAKEYDFINYTLFVTFFPHLIAGPIIHHKEMMPQFDALRNKVLNRQNIHQGIFLFSVGLFKKLVLADTFSIWAKYGFDQVRQMNMMEAWLVALSYTFQLYFDFSGYTDMALGTALFFNIKLPVNFNSPYKALNIRDFWKRWHMTLSRFFMDYVYIPLGGNKASQGRAYGNVLLTFFIGGIWHGAGWLFVVWGLLHGVANVVYRIWSSWGIRLHPLISWLLTFIFVNLSWVFFRSKDWPTACNILHSMVKASPPMHLKISDFIHPTTPINLTTVVAVGAGLMITLGLRNSNEMCARIRYQWSWAVLSGLLFGVSILFMVRKSPFLYFQF